MMDYVMSSNEIFFTPNAIMHCKKNVKEKVPLLILLISALDEITSKPASCSFWLRSSLVMPLFDSSLVMRCFAITSRSMGGAVLERLRNSVIFVKYLQETLAKYIINDVYSINMMYLHH